VAGRERLAADESPDIDPEPSKEQYRIRQVQTSYPGPGTDGLLTASKIATLKLNADPGKSDSHQTPCWRKTDCYDDAADLFRQLVEAPSFPEFLTLPAYDLITADAA
jgi:hypothetical protein